MDITLALGGGGIKGIAHIGVIECLENAGFHIKSVAGTSVGGLIGSVYAAGYAPREILALAESLDQDKLYTRRPGDGPSLMGYSGLVDVLVDVLAEAQFSDLKIPFACTAVDLKTAQEIYLNQGRVLDAVLATIAFPGVLPPMPRSDMNLVDGGILDPVPVNLARCMNPHLPVVAVVLNPERSEWYRIPQFNIISPNPLPIPTPIIEGFARMRVGQSLRIFLQSMDISSRMLTEMRLENDKPDVVIRPDVDQYGLFDKVQVNSLIEVGREAAKAALPSIQRSLTWGRRVRRIWKSSRPSKDNVLTCGEDSHPFADSQQDNPE